MQHPSKFAPSRAYGAIWARYSFAAAVSVLAWLVNVSIDGYLSRPFTPFLPGFAAIIAAAAWAGFGPGLLSTFIVTTWCGVYLHREGHSDMGVAVRCLIFAAEGLFLSAGSGRLRRASRQARRSEEWHRSLIDTSNEGIWVVDARGTVTYANPRMGEILGCVASELVGRRAEEFFFPPDLPMERIRFHDRRPGHREQFDRRLRRKDGSETWVLACSSSFPGNKGDSDGVLAMMTDITERKIAEQALRRSEQRFRGLFENVLEGVYQSTPEGQIIAANPMLLNMLGMASEAELNDVNIARDLYVDPGVRKRLLERLEQDGSFRNVEYQLRRRDGKTITVRENARAVRNEDGRVAYYEGTLSDVTELIQIESELLKAQYRHSVDTIAANIPHEFRNVLTVISGYAELMLEDLPVSHPARAAALDIQRTVAESSALAAQLVAFSSRREQSVDINRTILLSEGDRRRNPGTTPLRLALSPWSLPVEADQTHIERIVEDLMGAAQTVRAEAVRIDWPFVRNHAEARIGLFAKVTVSTPDGDFPLPDTLEIVSLCGGFTLNRSAENGGVESSVYLPIAREATPFLVSRLSGPGPQRTILLVEEEPLIREVSRDLLERQGYGVILAADASEADRIENYGHRFDLLIADLTTPQASAHLAQRFRLVRPGLKVLLIAAKAERRMEWADAYLEKPFSAEALDSEIRRALGTK